MVIQYKYKLFFWMLPLHLHGGEAWGRGSAEATQRRDVAGRLPPPCFCLDATSTAAAAATAAVLVPLLLPPQLLLLLR